MVTVRFFALLKEMAGKEAMEFPLKGEMPLKDFIDRLEDTMPEIADMIKKRQVLVSVNQEFATLDTVIKDGDEVALLPPFSGGTDKGLTGPVPRHRLASHGDSPDSTTPLCPSVNLGQSPLLCGGLRPACRQIGRALVTGTRQASNKTNKVL